MIAEVASHGWFAEYLGLMHDPAHLLNELSFTVLFDLALFPLGRFLIRRHDRQRHGHEQRRCRSRAGAWDIVERCRKRRGHDGPHDYDWVSDTLDRLARNSGAVACCPTCGAPLRYGLGVGAYCPSGAGCGASNA